MNGSGFLILSLEFEISHAHKRVITKIQNRWRTKRSKVFQKLVSPDGTFSYLPWPVLILIILNRLMRSSARIRKSSDFVGNFQSGFQVGTSNVDLEKVSVGDNFEMLVIVTVERSPTK